MHRPRTGDAEVGYLLFLCLYMYIAMKVIMLHVAFKCLIDMFLVHFQLNVFMLHFLFFLSFRNLCNVVHVIMVL